MDFKKVALSALLGEAAVSGFVKEPITRAKRIKPLRAIEDYKHDGGSEKKILLDFVLREEVKNDPKRAIPLLKNGGDPNLTNNINGNSLLHESVIGAGKHGMEDEYSNLIRSLVRYGANTQYRNYQGVTASELAKKNDNNEISKFIIKEDEKKYSNSNEAETYDQALAIASQNITLVTDPVEAIKILLFSICSGLDLEKSFRNNDTILSLAQNNWPKEQSDSLQAASHYTNLSIDLIRKSKESGIPVDKKDKEAIRTAWAEEVEPLVNFNNHNKGHFL